MKDTPQNYICFLSLGSIKGALTLWKVLNVVMAREIIKMIPESKAATQFLLHARRGELPLCNFLPEPNGHISAPTHNTSEGGK